MTKSLDRKLAAIHADPAGCKEFILAAAKDADMGFGLTAPGPERDACPHGFDQRQGCFKTLDDYLRQIRHVTAQGLVDIMLLSASNLERLAMREGIFRDTGQRHLGYLDRARRQIHPARQKHPPSASAVGRPRDHRGLQLIRMSLLSTLIRPSA